MGDELEQWPALERTPTMADGATGDGQAVGVGLCVARNEFAALPDVSVNGIIFLLD